MPNELNPIYGGYQPTTRYGHDATSSGAFGGNQPNLPLPTAQASGSASPPAYTPMAPYTPMVPGRSSRNFFANMDAPPAYDGLEPKALEKPVKENFWQIIGDNTKKANKFFNKVSKLDKAISNGTISPGDAASEATKLADMLGKFPAFSGDPRDRNLFHQMQAKISDIGAKYPATIGQKALTDVEGSLMSTNLTRI